MPNRPQIFQPGFGPETPSQRDARLFAERVQKEKDMIRGVGRRARQIVTEPRSFARDVFSGIKEVKEGFSNTFRKNR